MSGRGQKWPKVILSGLGFFERFWSEREVFWGGILEFSVQWMPLPALLSWI